MPAERRQHAEIIAVGALRYFMLKFTRNSVIAFDFHEALSFEGETGPYVQYAAVRAREHLAQICRARRGAARIRQGADAAKSLASALARKTCGNCCCWRPKQAAAVERAIASGEPAHVAKYAFQLAQSSATSITNTPCSPRENREKQRVAAVDDRYASRQLDANTRTYWAFNSLQYM